ncbi:CotH kinase family protein [Winogradskyella sp. SM1960]|uniref:CotH kinase family protein n=1 Tax=Winogradskyella sp. SM1960 TaxID=2865955 RepID=UPI001CD6C980|nr:CotH kinase family protein [Winogradskyella sp. SM1960]
MKNIYFFTLLFVSLLLSAQNNYEITVPEGRYQIDTTNELIICKIDITQFPDFSSYDAVILSLDTDYEFTVKPNTISHQESYTVEHNDVQYALFFSVFPIISINTELEIIDEPKRLATFVYADLEDIKTAQMGIELRGATSQTYPKKTYDLEFWEDPNGDENIDMQFGNLREDDDWVLDAIYNEPLRLRAFSSHQLWLDIHTPYYLDQEEDAKSGANVMYVDVFLNNEYNGVYMLSEQVDRKQLKLKKYNNDIRGELYKGDSWTSGNARFNELLDYDNTSDIWGDYELKLPDPDDAIDWENLYDFTDFVINSNLQDFRDEIGEKLKLENAFDYFIFLNLLRATDNTGKNLYTAKYNQDEPYFFAPWDLDGVFGTNWFGNNDNITDDILSNGLFNRLIHLTPDEAMGNMIAERWFELRLGVLSTEALNSRLTGNYNLLKDNLVYARERLIWQNYDYDEASKTYMDNWLLNRLDYLDIYFDNLLSVETFENDITSINVYPNPTTDFIYINSNITDITTYTITNIHGSVMAKGNFDPANNTITIKGFARGIYFLNLYNQVKKIIVK